MAELGSSGAGGKRTLVEEGTIFRGSMTSTCPVEIKGRIEGDVEAPALSISETGAVQGKAKVGEVTSKGELAGEIDADTVQLSGTVKDNTVIRAKTLEVKLTAPEDKMQVTFGNSVLAVGDEPIDDGQPGKRGKKKKEDDGQPGAGPGGPG
jgi:cytoskeletal protein CcmA (bactofilin family)